MNEDIELQRYGGMQVGILDLHVCMFEMSLNDYWRRSGKENEKSGERKGEKIKVSE